MEVPTEILLDIASNLNAKDLLNFRLVNRRFARIGLEFVLQNGLSVMNTARDLRKCHQLLECPIIAKNVRQLSFFHAEWPPSCPQKEWEIHPLLFGGNDRLRVQNLRINPRQTRQAFRNYLAFIKEEQERRYFDDVSRLSQIIRSLPNLRSAKVSHMQNFVWKPALNPRYRNLQSTIWVAPYLVNNISSAVEMLLLALAENLALKQLEIIGSLNPILLNLQYQFIPLQRIQKLLISSLLVKDNEDSIGEFLRAFPNLTELRIKFQGFGPTVRILGSLRWPSLRILSLSGIWTSEHELFEVFKNHSSTLHFFNLGHSALTQGSWKFLFTRVRTLRSEAKVTAEGELYGRSSRETLNMTPQEIKKLDVFMEDSKEIWPFN
ncbi:hypothetical protein G7Y89_g11319 [Cudoniella acicularis]|uniref:F-box domain-containing protein n=1 Tax=Cudoniella acicularis TaxID=354080 RepID=A0A8H4RB31_9HELO|nr:hypothetical protein G7Y89_g11319 [Cudoniella acicularis]